MRTLKKILVQRDLCDGCKDCENACRSLHGTNRINILEYDSSYYPILCQQCQDPACEVICPTGAMTGEGIESEKCIACGLCALACPFGAITIYDKSSEKCNPKFSVVTEPDIFLVIPSTFNLPKFKSLYNSLISCSIFSYVFILIA